LTTIYCGIDEMQKSTDTYKEGSRASPTGLPDATACSHIAKAVAVQPGKIRKLNQVLASNSNSAFMKYDLEKNETFITRAEAVKAIEAYLNKRNPGFSHIMRLSSARYLPAAIAIRLNKKPGPRI